MTAAATTPTWPKATLAVLLLLVAAAHQQPAEDASQLRRDCSRSYTTTCLKLDLVSWVERISEEDHYQILPGVTLVRDNDTAPASSTADLVAELARDFPKDPEARLDAFLLKKVTGFLGSHSLSLRLLDRQQVESARRRGGNKGGMQSAMAALAVMKGTLGALALGALAMMAGKALMAGMMSLMLSAIVGLKSLSGGGKSTTYEIVSKPMFSHAHTHSSSHEDAHGHGGGGGGYSSYGRSFDSPIPSFPNGDI